MAEFKHGRLGLRLVLKDAAELKQRDLEKYMAAYRAQKQGDSVPEAHGKSLRAALAAGWVREIEPVITAESSPSPSPSTGSGGSGGAVRPTDVGQQSPAVVRWLGMQVDRLYADLVTIPADMILEAAAHGEDPKSEPAAV